MRQMYDFIIIGAGVTGITLCKKLRERGVGSVLVLEKENEPGGLCRTRIVEGHTLDIGGGHFFNTKFKEVEEYVFKYIPKNEFNYFEKCFHVSVILCSVLPNIATCADRAFLPTACAEHARSAFG